VQKKTLTTVLVIAVMGALAFGAYYGTMRLRGVGAQGASTSAESSSAISADAPTIYFVRDPEAAPSFSTRDLKGNLITSADWKGKAVLLNFWATWCPPCRAEIPALVELQKKYADRLLVIGASQDDLPPEEVQAFADELGINYPVVMASEEMVKAWGGVEALPTTFLINPEGLVMGKHRGALTAEVADLKSRALMGMNVNARIERIPDTGQVFLKNAANATELPDVDFTGLSDDQKKVALRRLNSESCTCGCNLTLAQCRLNDTTCATSRTIAAELVKEVASGTGSSANPAQVAPLGH
jgi:thiol-disulfide isomerase/thioredoxin